MYDTVLHGRCGAASGLSECRWLEGQETVMVQGLVRCPPHLQLVSQSMCEVTRGKCLNIWHLCLM
jgi:hypothetical protein